MTVAQQAPPKAPTYFALAVISVLLRIFGWLEVLGGIVLIVLSLATSRSVHISEPVQTGQVQWSAAAVGAFSGAAALVGGIFIVGVGEALEAVRDIARNSFRWHP